MNPTQVGGLVRNGLAWGLGYLAARGFFPAGAVDWVVTIGGVVGVGLWSVYSNKITTMIGAIEQSAPVVVVPKRAVRK